MSEANSVSPSLIEFGVGPRNTAAENDFRIQTRLLPFAAKYPSTAIQMPAREPGEAGPLAIRIADVIPIEQALTINGAGSNALHENAPGVADYGAGFIWDGPDDPPCMMSVAPVAGALSRRLANFQMRDVAFFGQGKVLKCVDVRSVAYSLIERCSMQGAKQAAFACGVVSQLAPGEARDLMHNNFTDMRIYQVGASDGVGWLNLGDDGANVCKNNFSATTVFFKNASGIVERNADTNTWLEATLHPWGDPNAPGVYALDLQGGASPAGCARSEEFKWLSTGGGRVRVAGVNHLDDIGNPFAVAAGEFGEHEIRFDYENTPHNVFEIGQRARVRITNCDSFFRAHKADGETFSAVWPNPPATITGWANTVANPHGAWTPSTGRYRALTPGPHEFGLVLAHDNTITPGSRWDIQLMSSNGSFDSYSYNAAAAAYNSVALPPWNVRLDAGEEVWWTIRRVGGSGVFKLHADAQMVRCWGGLRA